MSVIRLRANNSALSRCWSLMIVAVVALCCARAEGSINGPSQAAGHDSNFVGWFEPTLVNILISVGVIFAVVLAVPKSRRWFLEIVFSDFQTFRSENGLWAPLPASAQDGASKPMADENDLTKFRAELRATPGSSDTALTEKVHLQSQSPTGKVTDAPTTTTGSSDSLKEFHAWSQERLAIVHNLCEQITKTLDKVPPRDGLLELCREIRALKERATAPELLPTRQLASALEGLLQQLSDRVREVTTSTMRTAANAIDLLSEICKSGIKADLATNPPMRFLAVDDDAVSRFAISYALKKAFDQPDLAEDAEAALSLAAKESYDVIFLDVKMPGMDGFELCTKIHEAAPNRSTPVVFVTRMKDFDSRTKSAASGGSDLIGKPFLPFEITVKALTFAMQRRLKSGDKTVKESPQSTQLKAPVGVPAANTNPIPAQNRPLKPAAVSGSNTSQISKSAAGNSSAGIRAFASTRVHEIQEQLQMLDQTGDETARWKILAPLYLHLQDLSHKLDNLDLRPAHRVCSAMEGLMKKLLENTKSATPATIHTLVTAADLLADLCLTGVKPDLADNPGISILVVDDDPLTRRAITGVLQTGFLKPDNAETGETALAIAAEKPFDVIFMDVQMPGMDGFTACSKIRETAANRTTPVVFVTSHTDSTTRDKSALAGGSDFVTKPFVFSEITVKALTFALRGRLALASLDTDIVASPTAKP